MFKLFLLEQQSERVHSHLLVDSPQMPTMARVEQGLCQELEMQCRCPLWIAESLFPEPSALARSWSQEPELRRKPRHTNGGCDRTPDP